MCLFSCLSRLVLPLLTVYDWEDLIWRQRSCAERSLPCDISSYIEYDGCGEIHRRPFPGSNLSVSRGLWWSPLFVSIPPCNFMNLAPVLTHHYSLQSMSLRWIIEDYMGIFRPKSQTIKVPHPLSPQITFFLNSWLSSAPSYHCNWKGNNASMLLSFHHFVSHSASPSTPSPYNSLFFALPHIFLAHDPPSSPFSPLQCISFFQAPRRWEAVLSVQKSIGLTHLWGGLPRQHHHCIWLYSMSKGGQLRWGRPRGASSAVYCIIEERISAISCRKTKAEIVLLAATDWRAVENRADRSRNPAAVRQKLMFLYAGCPGICQVERYSDGDL